ncbi:MAG: MFS transporter [Solirubrobacterales bacterium]|nr:MFS transporter [Solirubrobacterales bacterium]
MWRPLRNKNFRLLFIGRVVDQLGDAVSPAALALAIVAATRSSVDIAVVLVCSTLPKIALLPLGGVVVDRLGARRVALAAALVSCPAQLTIAVVLLGGRIALVPIAVASTVAGIAAGFDTPATLPLVVGTTETSERQGANATMSIAASATNLGGPAVAGLLIFTVGAGWAFVLDALTFLVSAGTLVALEFRGSPIARQSLREDLVSGWSEVRARTWYWTSLIGHGTWNFAAGMLLTTGPLIAVVHMGGRAVWLTALQAAGVGYLSGAFIAGRWKLRRAVLACNIAQLSFALPLVAFAFDAPAWLAVASYGLAMASLGFLNPVWETVVQQQVPASVLARVSSYDWLISLVGMPVGYVLGPILGRGFGYALPLSVAAGLVLVAGLVPISLAKVRAVRLAPASVQQ